MCKLFIFKGIFQQNKRINMHILIVSFKAHKYTSVLGTYMFGIDFLKMNKCPYIKISRLHMPMNLIVYRC